MARYIRPATQRGRLKPKRSTPKPVPAPTPVEADEEPELEPDDSDDELDALRDEATALGVKVDRRWGATRLRQEIEDAHGSDAPSEPDPEEG